MAKQTPNASSKTKPKAKSVQKSSAKPAAKKQFFLIRWVKGLVNYFVGAYNELKKVTWPTGKELMKSTGIVILIIAVFTVVIYFFDTVFSYLTNLIYNLG
ncbi:MAG: preprotein translocase subunit SecE [Anaerofustis sp.]